MYVFLLLKPKGRPIKARIKFPPFSHFSREIHRNIVCDLEQADRSDSVVIFKKMLNINSHTLLGTEVTEALNVVAASYL